MILPSPEASLLNRPFHLWHSLRRKRQGIDRAVIKFCLGQRQKTAAKCGVRKARHGVRQHKAGGGTHVGARRQRRRASGPASGPHAVTTLDSTFAEADVSALRNRHKALQAQVRRLEAEWSGKPFEIVYEDDFLVAFGSFRNELSSVADSDQEVAHVDRIFERIDVKGKQVDLVAISLFKLVLVDATILVMSLP